jgi:3-oxoadipate enol-lactonase
MTWIARNGVRLYAERRGDGPPLLSISGTGADLAVHPNGFDLPFALSFDTACYDQRGLGRSTGPGPEPDSKPPWTMADYADDAAAVLDWAGWRQADVLGVSFGGMVAQELMLRHPGRVRRAVLACTSSGGPGGPSYPLHALAGLPAAERAAAMLPLIDTRWADPDRADMVRDFAAAALQTAPPPGPGALAQLEARRLHDTWSRLPQITAPVLVCAGRYDGIAPAANSEALAARIPGARLEVFDGGHAFLFQDPASDDAIRDFLLDPEPARWNSGPFDQIKIFSPERTRGDSGTSALRRPGENVEPGDENGER